MIIPDANLLLYAADKECADHAKAASWWRKALHGSEDIGLCAVVAFGFSGWRPTARSSGILSP